MSKETALAAMTGQTAPVAAPQTPPPEAQKPVESDRFAVLASKEAKLQKEREAVKAEKLAVDTLKAELSKYKGEIDEFETLKKTDKIAALKKIGFTEEDILNFVAGKEEPTPPTMEEIAAAAAKKEREEWEKAQQERDLKAQQERDEKNIKAFKDGIGETIKKETEKYEYLNHNGEVAQELVYETILGFMKEDAELSPLDAMKEALEAVEAFYEEEFTKIMALKKFQAKIKPTEAVVETKEDPLKKKVVQAPTQPVAPIEKPQRPVDKPTPPARETASQKRERLEAMLRNMSKG